MALKLKFANGFYQSKSLPLVNQQCVGLYPSIPETQGALNDESLFQLPGLTQAAASEAYRESNRGSWVMNEIPYFVNDTNFYRLNSDETKTNLGTIATGTRVSMADNGVQLVILVPGGTGYVYTVAGGLVTIVDGNFTASGNPQLVVYLDGYFVFTTDTKKFMHSNLNDATTYTATDFGSAEYDPDTIVAPVVVNNQLHIVGSLTDEAFRNVGGTGFAFQRSGVFLDKGCIARFSLIESSGSFYMIGKGKDESPGIYKYEANRLRKISTEAIDSYLNKKVALSDLQAAYALSFSYDGDFFVCFSLPDTTFCFNIRNERWFEVTSTINDEQEKWRVASIATAYGKTYVGDTFDGRIGYFDPESYGDYGTDIQKTFTCEVFDSGGDPFSITKVELTIESGAGPAIIRSVPQGDGAARVWVADIGSATIDGDIIQFPSGANRIKDDSYWERGETYLISISISDTTSTFDLTPPYALGDVLDSVSIEGDYTYNYTVPTGSIVNENVYISWFSGGTGTVTVNFIKKYEPEEVDPLCTMEVSRDGKKFNTPLKRSMGKEGEFNMRQIWRSIPNFDRFGLLKFNFSEQVKTAILKLEVE